LILAYLPASFPFVFALVGVVLSYATVAASGPGAAAIDDVCAGAAGGPACEAPATDLEETYATPLEIDCPAGQLPQPAGDRLQARQDFAPTGFIQPTFVQPTFVDPSFVGCSPPVLDFHYRVSRVPESERPNGALRPQRARRNGPAVAACTGLPLERETQLSGGAAQPAAMYATLTLLPPASATARFGATEDRSSRMLEPLDRPPRV
jgi:hypothetical protein